MKQKHRAWLAAGLLAGAAALTGCSATTMPTATPTPDTAQKITAQPDAPEATVSPDESPEADTQESEALLALRVGESELEAGAVAEDGEIYLPLVMTAEALGFKVTEETKEEETQTRRSVVMEKDESRISVSWVSSDNTAKQITWQKDGLLIPVDTRLTSVGNETYVPAAFFETAVRVKVDRQEDGVLVSLPEPADTPPNDVDNADKNEDKEDGQNG